MADNLWSYIDSCLLPSLYIPINKVEGILTQNKGARIGESAVVSRKMHTFNPNTPEKVNILQGVDAGQAFYQRKEPGSICHIDIFHQCGKVDHRIVASNIKKAIGAYNLHFSVNKMMFNSSSINAVAADYIDIQTGTGGGRITGSLTYGKKLSLQRAHENHVHIAIAIPNDHLASIFYIVLAAEEAILAQGLELRCNEQLIHVKESGGNTIDSSPYTDQSDSYLQEKSSNSRSPAVNKHQFTQDAIILADNFDTIQDVKKVLDEIVNGADRKRLEQNFDVNGNAEQMLSSLIGTGVIELRGKKLCITDYGKEFKQYLDQNFPDIQAYLRQVLKSFKPVSSQAGRSIDTQATGKQGKGSKLLLPYEKNINYTELAIAETVISAARRKVNSVIGQVNFDQSDLCVYVRKKRTTSDILLLIDASASMKGQRILAAKFLVRHLLLSTPDRVGVITFQNYKACLQVPFTRDYNQIEDSLQKIKVAGATPLALGLKTCLKYLDTTRTSNPFIILLTDGVPTLAEMTRDPVADALSYAKCIKETGYKFMSIGLKPNKNYLANLTECAGGKVYLFDELEKQVLINATWTERR